MRVQAFAGVMARLAGDAALGDRMGAAGRGRVVELFSRDAFAESLDATCAALVCAPPPRGRARWLLVQLACMAAAAGASAWVGAALLAARARGGAGE